MFDPVSLLIRLIIGVVLSAASTLWSQANKVEKQKKTGTRGSSQVGGKVPQSFLIGTVGDSGKLVYPRSTWGNSGEVPNAYLTTVLSFGSMPVTAMTGLFMSSSAVTLNTASPSAQGYAVPEYFINGKNHLWQSFQRGVQTSASTFLTSKFASDPDRPWTTDMVGRGVPYLTATMLWGDGVWPSPAPPIVGQFQGIALYDIRKDSTRGGSGSHRWAGEVPSPAEQATWEFSDNNMVINYNILRGIFYNGQRVWGGRSSASELPFAVWKAAMDKCDVVIAKVGGGTERAFRGGRKIYVNEEPRNVVNEFLVGCNGRISYASDGTVYPLVGVPDEADGAFTDADVLASEPLGSIPLPRLDDIINGATATYREPVQAWEDKETAPYYRSDLEAEDDGRRQTEGLSLDTTFSGTQAQRVLKATVEEARRFGRHVVALRAPFAQFRPLQTLAWTSDRFGYEGKLFLITVRTRPIWGWVVLGLQEIDPADHDWTPSTDEKPLSFAPVVTNRPAPQEVSGPSVAPVPGELAFDAFWSAPSVAVDVDFVRITYRLPADDETRVTVPVPKPDLLLGSARVPVALSLANTAIEVQLEYISWSGRPMTASAWMPVTIADVRIGWEDMTAELRETLEGVTEFMDEEVPAIRAELADMGDDLDALAGAPVFAYGDAYAVNDLVRYAGGIYRATVANSDVLPTDATKWVQVGEYNSVAGTVIGFTARFENVETTAENTATSLIQTTRDTRRIQNALLAAAMLNAEQGQNQVLENTDQLAASAQVSETMRTEVSRIDGTTTALAEQINVVQAQVENDIAQSISAVTTLVENVDGRVTAEATRVDQLRAVIGDSAAEIVMKGTIMNGPGGPNSRWAVRLQTSNNGAVVATGMLFVDIIGGEATIGFQANKTVFYTSDGTAIALLTDDKKLRSANGAYEVNMVTGDVTMTRGEIRSSDGKFLISPSLKRMSISS